MALAKTGVQLVAEGADAYLSTLTKTASAETALGVAARPAVAAINQLDDKEAAAAKAAASFAEMSAMAAKNAAEFGKDSATAAGGADKLGTETGGAMRQLDMFAGDAALAAKDADKLGSEAGDTAKKLGDLGGGAGGAGKDVKNLGDDAEKGGKGLNALEQAAVGALRKLGEMAVEGAARAGQAILDFAVNGTKAAGDFEQGMNRFASVVGSSLDDSGKSLDDFKELFISLGRDLPVSTAEVQQAAIEMAKGGIEPATIAAGGLRSALDLAAAGEVGIAQSAEIMSKQLGVWVDRAADATTKSRFLGEAADLLAQAANASTVDVDELALGMANVGGIAKVTGLSFRETVTTMALLSPGFSSAADAGTSLKTMLTRLQPTTDTAAQAMKSLGLLTAQGTSKFYDAQGSFIGMDKAAELLHGSLSGLSEAQKTAALQAIFGNDAFRAGALLAEAGAKGFADMGESMGKAGTASEQAAKKQQGFNVAVENVKGSLEALQITVFSAVLPSLTKLANILAGGINAVTEYAKATIEGKTALSAIAGTVKDLALPALAGLTAALIAYALVQTAQAGPAILALIPKIIASTVAFAAQALAVAAAVAPYALIALAIGGVVKAYSDFNSKVSTATTQLLNSRQWWTDSTKAIEDYGNATGETAKKLAPYGETVKAIRAQIQGEVEDLGRRMAAGLVNEQQYQTEMAAINVHTQALQTATSAYNVQEQAIIAETAASMTATNQAAVLTTNTAALGNQASLTASDVEELGKKLQDTYQKGQEAVQAYATSQSEFLSGIEQRQADHAAKIAALEAEKQKATTDKEKEGIDARISQENGSYATQEQNAGAAYARQQAQQQRHLGQMLIDYTVSQASLGNISKEKAAEITSGLEKEYGLQESSVATTFLHMAGSIDGFAHSSSGSIDGLIGTLRDQQNQAGDTQKAMDDYAKEYVATQTNNFLAGKIDAEAYTHAMEHIPRYVQTEVNTRYTQTGSPHNAPEQYASGGRFAGTEPIIVGEQGAELIFPSSAGTVISSEQVRSALASPAQMASMSTTTHTRSSLVVNVDARGANVTPGQIENAVYAGITAYDRTASRNADARIRTGA